MKAVALIVAASVMAALPGVALAQSTPAAPQPAKVANPPMPAGAKADGSAVAEKDRPANTTPPSATTTESPKPAGK